MASSYLLLFLILLPLLLFFKSIFKSLYSKHAYNLPPGPWTLPVIGSLHHLISKGLSHHALRDLSVQYGGLMFLQLGEQPTVVVSSKEAAKEIMKTHDVKFCDRPVINTLKLIDYVTKDIVFSPYNDLWREMRKVVVLGLLTPKRVQSFRSIREDEINSMIKNISSLSCSKQLINLSDMLYSLTIDVTLRCITGSKSKEKRLFLMEIFNRLEFIAMFNITNMVPSLHFLGVFTGVARRAKLCRDSIEQFLGEIIKEHRAKDEMDGDADDMISVLLRLHDEDSAKSRLTMDNVIAVIFDALGGGIEPISAILQWAMAELIKNPVVMKTAQNEIRQQLGRDKSLTESDLVELNIVRLIIKETMRLHPPNSLLVPRECRETCKILGYDIPKGTTVLVNAWAMGRNSSYWKDAEEFKPERVLEADANLESGTGDYKFVPFGAGRRGCPGSSFALVIMELVLANLLYHFDWELPDGMSRDEIDMTESLGITAKRKSPMLLHAVPY